MAENNDVEVRISGKVDPSLRVSTAAAKAAIAELGAAAEALNIAQRSMAAGVLAGEISLESLGRTLKLTSGEYQKIAEVVALVQAKQRGGVAGLAEESFARDALTASTISGLERTAEYEAAAYAKRKAEVQALSDLKARQVGGNFAQDANALLGVTGVGGKSAKESAQVFQEVQAEEVAAAKVAAAEIAAADATAIAATLAEEKAAQLSYKAGKAQEVAIAKEAAAAKVAAEKVTSTVPLYAAQQKFAQATAAANAQLKAGAITEEENAAAIAHATGAYNANVAAMLKSGAALKSETGELIANTVAQNAQTTAKDAFFKKLTSGRSVYEGEAAARAILTGNVGRLSSAMAVEATRLDILKYAFSGVGLAVAAGAATLVAFGVALHEATKDAQWAEKLKRTADTLGLTTTKLQEFDFVFQSLGIDVEKGQKTLSGLNQTIGQVEAGGTRAKQVTKIFKDELNITPDQLRGWGDLGTQIPQIVDALSKMNVQEREAAEKRLKVDPEVIQSLIDHKNAIAGLIEEAHKYGVIIPADVIDTSGRAAAKMREWKVVVDGELRSAFITLAPLITGLGQNVADIALGFADLVRGMHTVAGEVDKLLQPIRDLENLMGIKPKGLIDSLKEMDEWIIKSYLPLGGLIQKLEKLGAIKRGQDEAKIKAEPKAAPQGPPAVNLLGPTTKAPKGPGKVAEWTEQLHAQEVASNNFFGDQTEAELAFWQKKVALTKKGSRDWLEVQSKIYDAQKKLARDKYDDDIANMNVKLAIDKDVWATEKADWVEKLTYIKSKFTEESREYKDAYRALEEAERQHAKTMREIARQDAEEKITELKSTLATNRAIREENAKQAGSEILSKAKYSGDPLAEVHAEVQIAAIRRQTSRQNLSDMEQEYVASDRLLTANVANAIKDSDEYHKAARAKQLADVEFANKHRELMNQMVNQDAASAQKIRDTWHAKIDPMIKFTGSEIKGLIEGTKSWGQVLNDIGSQAISAIIGAIEKMVEAWIIGLITTKATQSTTAAAQVISNAGVAGSAGVASMAGAPFPIDLTAPAFGEAMAATALGFAGMASLDTGTNYVPGDMLAQIHEGERVVPKADNASLMQAVGAGGGGNTHNHHYDLSSTINGGSHPDVIKALKERTSDLARVLKGMHRDNQLAFAR